MNGIHCALWWPINITDHGPKCALYLFNPLKPKRRPLYLKT